MTKNKKPNKTLTILIIILASLTILSSPISAAELGQANKQAVSSITNNNQTGLLAIYILAFDNDPTSTANLTPQYQPTLEEIVNAVRSDFQKTAVILADLDDSGDTHILVVKDGIITPIVGLPNAQGILNTSTTEYDMSDGANLGGFIKWSRNTYPATQTILTYVGHGASLTPETDINLLFNQEGKVVNNSPILPLPHYRGLKVDFTDHHPISLVSPYDLAYALNIGTNNGQDPIAVLDLSLCFSASIEQFYELYPYTQTLTGSPNYTYAAPEMLGEALSNIQTTMTASDMADTIVKTYDEVLPQDDHPRILVAVNSNILPQIKQQWDTTAFHLMQSFNNNAQLTKTKLSDAYDSSAKYDTTFCEPNWELAPPDALSDMADFAIKIADRFGQNSQVGISAFNTAQYIQQAIIATYIKNGEPWFATSNPKPTWTFTGAGLAIYTDFSPFLEENGITYLSQQAPWYTNDISTYNQHPYTFIQKNNNQTTWADVFNKFWEGHNIQPAPCLPSFPPAQNDGELSADAITYPVTDLNNLISVDSPVIPSVAINSDTIAENPLVEFTILQDGQVVYSDVVGAGYLVAGTHEIVASKTWLPTNDGAFELIVNIDTDNRIVENNETDNNISFIGDVLPQHARPQIDGQVSYNWQWLNEPEIPLNLWQLADNLAPDVEQLKIEVYQYEFGKPPYVQVPTKLYEETYENISLASFTEFSLSPHVEYGPVILKIWGISAQDVISINPTIIEFNYTPLDMTIRSGEEHYYLFNANTGDRMAVDLSVSTGYDADLLMWLPRKHGSPTWQATTTGDDNITLNPVPYGGQYLLSVRGKTDANYNLNIYKNGRLEGGDPVNQFIYLPFVVHYQ